MIKARKHIKSQSVNVFSQLQYINKVKLHDKTGGDIHC